LQDSTRGTIRSDLNNENWSFNEKRQAILEFITYGATIIHNKELGIEEFYCPERPGEHFLNKRTTEACECMTRNIGCKKINECKAYEQQKNIQKLYPCIRWDFPIKTKEEEIIKINLIKKGAIIPPELRSESCCGGLK
jgi:hypothetical protein